MTYDLYTIEFRGKYTGMIYKTLETTVYKEALKLSKLYLPTVEEINDIEAYALIKRMAGTLLRSGGMRSGSVLKKS